MSRRAPDDPGRALILLRRGEVKVRGLMPDCSNYTYLAQVCTNEEEALAIYKPQRGEVPLADFPTGTLARREVAAYLVDTALGWGIVPPTVFRADGPLGPGSLQLFIRADLREHYFTLVPTRADDFRVMAAFDWIVNNADRKSGHCLLDQGGHIWGVDNGLTFHPLPKLRTVIWEFAGQEIPRRLRDDAARLAHDLTQPSAWTKGVATLIKRIELGALAERARRVAVDGRYPEPGSRWAYPWPLV